MLTRSSTLWLLPFTCCYGRWDRHFSVLAEFPPHHTQRNQQHHLHVQWFYKAGLSEQLQGLQRQSCTRSSAVAARFRSRVTAKTQLPMLCFLNGEHVDKREGTSVVMKHSKEEATLRRNEPACTQPDPLQTSQPSQGMSVCD